MAVDLSLTNTYFLDRVDSLVPLKNHLIVECDEEEMLRIGNTDLILGYWDDNRNNAHWFGKVFKENGTPLDVGDMVWFSYLSAKGMDRILCNGLLYIFLPFRDVILRKRESIEMLNGNILSQPLERKKHSFLDYEEEEDPYYTRVAHVPEGSKFKAGDVVHYWLNQVYILEGQRKLLGEDYRVIREEHILTQLIDGEEHPIDGCVLVEVEKEELKLSSGITLLNPIKVNRKLSKGRVIRSTCSVEQGLDVYVRTSRGYTVGEHMLFREEHVEAIC